MSFRSKLNCDIIIIIILFLQVDTINFPPFLISILARHDRVYYSRFS